MVREYGHLTFAVAFDDFHCQVKWQVAEINASEIPASFRRHILTTFDVDQAPHYQE